ncbi:class I SAM-dependent methyltransferase [Mesorhizobium sp. M6A.T.Ce.TU.016.01.1.1]|uniref:class I SAM-dependent methyltransferase n=1 Tax=Mesorhizobium sp. M6A.T.Ce.TU.016.01.1.1 TaxID=2496783 RepID=UPI000FCB3627|nr:class I SAM-dependent methyltransferase [Mesorhizobium sp. M6A.T.Ce.TU.016.01.1.1]RUU29758.1 class I SAM-dependent methyltransferase [Mesorhizobium sp. M6A.T.Ce.TU.016.01.1.1]
MNMHAAQGELANGERQVSPTIDGIRRDHTARYEFAAKQFRKPSRLVDLACGVGYGSAILADAGHTVVGIDRSEAAIDYGRAHFHRDKVALRAGDVMEAEGFVANSFDAAVCFETIEHLADPLPMLKALHAVAPRLVASVPNETVFPHRGRILHHHRHYTRAEFAELLESAGWRVTGWFGQVGPESEVEPDVEGRTIVVTASRAGKGKRKSLAPKSVAVAAAPAPALPAPEHVVILGLGPSLEAYVDMVKRLGGRHALSDEVWGINAVAGVIQCDRVFHMDDVRVQEARAAARPDSNIARMLEWMRKHPGPIYTSQVHSGYPGLVAFPLEEVINSCGWAYFNSTAAYAIAYAVHIGVKKISIWGADFTYANSHQAEKGRACVEFHLGIAAERGIEIGFPAQTSLMDANAPITDRLYGYDLVDLSFEDTGERHVVTMVPHDRLPTADAIEARYDHAKHPNPLVKG